MKMMCSTLVFVMALLIVPTSLALIKATGKVIEVTSDNLYEFLDSEYYLLEFYMPGCGACVTFRSQYEKVAENMLSYGEDFPVGAIDGTKYPLLSAKFSIEHFPTVFLKRGNKLWLYNGPMLADNIVKFAKQGFNRAEPVPFWDTPLGITGTIRGMFLDVAYWASNVMPKITSYLGLPEWAGVILLIFGFSVGSLVVTTIAIYFHVTAHMKND